MAYQSDSDGGSWVLVGKDTDSDASSDVIPYDTGLPEEVSENDDVLIGSVWRNQDEIVSDSDIEACSKESEESDSETDVNVLQAAVRMSESEHEDLFSSMEKSGKDSSLPSDTILKSIFSSTEDNLPENVEDTEPEMCLTDEDRPEDPQVNINCDDSVTEDMTSQEEVNVSLNGVIIQLTKPQPTFEEGESLPLSRVSLHSDFERITSSSDLVTSDAATEPETLPNYTSNMVLAMPECTEETVEPEAVEDLPHSDDSEAGSSGSADFAVISTLAPVEVVPHRTENTLLTEDDHFPTSREKIDVAAGPDEACQQRPVGLVTCHASPPNHRLLISVIMISCGVGFLLGRCAIPSTILLSYEDHYAPIDKTDIEEAPMSVQHIYHSATPLPSDSSEPAIPLLTSPNKEVNGNIVTRYRLMIEGSKLRNRNKRLRTIVEKLRSQNKRIVMEQSASHTAANDTTIAWNMLKQSCLNQQRINEFKMANQERKLRLIVAQLEDAKHDNVILNNIIALYKILQTQHFEFLDLQQLTVKFNNLEKTKLTKRLDAMELSLGRYKRDSKGLLQQLMRMKSRSFYLEMLVQQNDILKQPCDSKSPLTQDTASPLLKAIASHSQTCHSGTKTQVQIKWLKSKVKGQRSLVRKLEQEEKLKSKALEMLYNSMGELRNYAICLKQQVQILPLERARDAPAICRSIPKDVPTKSQPPKPNSLPQCSYPINGTLVMDFSSMNIALKPLSDDLHAYELKLLSDKVKPTLVFNSTLLMTSMCDLTLNSNMTADPSDPKGHLVPMVLYTRMAKRNALVQRGLEARVAGFSDLQKVCESNNQSLDVSRKERQNVENQLVVAKNDLKRLRQEKKDLNRKLMNATSELKKKSSMKNCLKSTLNVDELMNRVNSSKSYKAASKMAKKVKKASRKAWTKLKKFVKKFGSSEYGDFDDDESKTHHDDHKAQVIHEKKKHPRDFEDDESKTHHDDHKAQEIHEKKKHPRDFDDDNDDFHETLRKKHHQNFSDWDDKFDDKDDFHDKMQEKRKHRHELHEPKDRNHGSKQCPSQSKKHNHREFQKSHKNNHKHGHDPNFEKRQQKPAKIEENFINQKPKQPQNPQRQLQKEADDKCFSNYEQKSMPEKEIGGEDSQQWHKGPRQGRRPQGKGDRGKLHHFRDLIENPVNMAKKAGQKLVHDLMPIYDKWQKVYCKVEKEVPQKSFTEIWESLGELANEKQPTSMTRDDNTFVEERNDDPDTDCHWSICDYQNITEFVNPAVEIPEKVELPAWENHGNGNHGNNGDRFLKMVEKRTKLGFQNSEDKKNWYLKMLEAGHGAEIKYEAWGNGKRYEEMFKAPKYMRDYHDAQWYHMMTAERETAREMSSSYGSSGEWCQA